MQSLALATISESRSEPCEPQKRSSLLRHWLGLFALNAGQPLDADALSVYVTLWTEGFADLSDDVLEAAFKKTLATCKFWPIKIADVREHIESAQDSRAEDEWQALLEYCQRWVNADTARDNPPPRLPSDVDHAARAAGGIFYLEACSQKDLIFAKQRFVEDLTRQRKTGDIAGFLPCSELQGMLEAAAQRFALPPVAQEYFGHGTRKSLSDATTQTGDPIPSVPENYSQRSYGLQREQDPALVEMVRCGEQKFKAVIDRDCAEWRKAHNL